MVEAPIKPPRDKTAIAKTSGGVRRITLRESPGRDLSFLIIFIVFRYVCRSFLTAEPKENYFKNPDLKSFSSILPLRETSYFDVPILESVTYIARTNNVVQAVFLYYSIRLKTRINSTPLSRIRCWNNAQGKTTYFSLIYRSISNSK